MTPARAGPKLQIPTARVFAPLLQPARYKGAFGGRGSAKSHFFAEHLIDECFRVPGTRAVCLRELQNTLRDSSKRLIEDKIQKFGVGQWFDVQTSLIKTPGDGLIIFEGLQDHTAESIKSLEGFRIASVDEAQSIKDRSLTILRPTLRNDAELWFAWNPESPDDPVDKLLRGPEPPPRSIVVQANWRDNPWFPADLREEMAHDRGLDPIKAGWVWDGLYRQEGEYFRKAWFLPVDHLLPTDSYRVYGGSDYAVTANGGDYTVHVVLGIDPDGNPWVLDVWRQQATSDVWIDAWCNLVRKWNPSEWAEERGQILSGVGPFLEREARERKAYTYRRQFTSRSDKAVRAQSFRGLIATRGLRILASAPWRAAFEAELLQFSPTCVHDDQVDACGLVGQLLDEALDGPRPPKEEEKQRDDYKPAFSRHDRDDGMDVMSL